MEYMHSGILYSCENSKEALYILMEIRILQEILENYSVVDKYTFQQKVG